MRTADARVAGVECLVCGTGYTGEDGVELLIRARRARARVWDALTGSGAAAGRPRRARHAAARGLLPPLWQRPVRGAQPDRGGTRLVLQARDGVRRGRRAARRAGTAAGSLRADRARHSRGRKTAISTPAGDGVVTSGTFSPCLEIGIGMAYVPSEATEARNSDRDRREGPYPRRRGARAAAVSQELRLPERRPEDFNHDHARAAGRSLSGRIRVAEHYPDELQVSRRARLGANRGGRARRSGSPGSRRTSSARSFSSTSPRSATR